MLYVKQIIRTFHDRKKKSHHIYQQLSKNEVSGVARAEEKATTYLMGDSRSELGTVGKRPGRERSNASLIFIFKFFFLSKKKILLFSVYTY